MEFSQHLSQAQHSTTPRLAIFMLTVPHAESFIMKLCVKALGVPTITYDMAVQTRLLHKLGEPIILFGEKEMEWHERLLTIIGNWMLKGSYC